jgi:FG-GAP repeat/RTX calcium-binding nonapeptide repeat (4 copies)
MAMLRTRILCGAASAALLLVAASNAQAQFSSFEFLSELDAGKGLRFYGAVSGDGSGAAVRAAGDINGDGLGDVIISAPGADPNGDDSGAAYVVFGRRTPSAIPIELSELDGDNGFRLAGRKAEDLTGFSVGGAGDVNGDGFDDVVVSAPGTDHSGSSSGSAYVVFGKAAGFQPFVELSGLNGKNGFRIDGRAATHFTGFSADGAGDVNGDGFDDVLVTAAYAAPNGTASGSAYVVFGRKSGWKTKFKLTSLNGKNGFRINGEAAIDVLGASAASAGDINADGFADIVIGAPLADVSGAGEAGKAYVMFGKAKGFSASVNAGSLTGAKGFAFTGSANGNRTGSSVGAAGDVNGDGFDDIIIGASNASNGGTGEGSSYVIFGKKTAFSSPFPAGNLNGVNGFRLDGFGSGEESGSAVGGKFDINGDGFSDLLVAAPNSEVNLVSEVGTCYVYFGNKDPIDPVIEMIALGGVDGFQFSGETGGDRACNAASAAGDFNGDGIGDVVVGAKDASPLGRTEAGISYIYFGRVPTSFVVRQGSVTGQYISGGPGPDILAGLEGNDVLEGRGGLIDSLFGGGGKDTASYKHANAAVIANMSDSSANTGDATDDVYDNIEWLEGTRFDDTLTGDGEDNRITGGKGKDVLRGLAGKDRFVVTAVTDSLDGSATRDEILDFNPGTVSSVKDVLDLKGVDAKTGQRGNQKFKFIGTASFSGAKGELRLKQSGANLIVQGDTNGNKQPDLEIVLKGAKSKLAKFTVKDFKL